MLYLDFPGGSDGKASVYNAEDLGSIPGSGSSLEKEKATHSSTLAQKIPWTEEPGVHGVAKSQTRLSDFTQGWDWGMTTMSTRDLWDDGHVLKLDDSNGCAHLCTFLLKTLNFKNR